MYEPKVALPVDPSCPWGKFESPSIRFCEEPQCAWISQPANTWSNVSYLVIGIYLLVHFIKKKETHGPLFWFGPIALSIWAGSSLFHATYTFWGEVLDLGAMFLFSGLILTLNLVRDGWFGTRNKALAFFLGVLAFSIALLLIYKSVGIAVFTIEMIIAGLVELKLAIKRSKNRPQNTQLYSYKYFWIANVFLVFAQIVWQLDFRQIWCDPDNHVIQGHAAWHLLNGVSYYYAYLFYSQFPALFSAKTRIDSIVP